jgi:hypothetical protein
MSRLVSAIVETRTTEMEREAQLGLSVNAGTISESEAMTLTPALHSKVSDWAAGATGGLAIVGAASVTWPSSP